LFDGYSKRCRDFRRETGREPLRRSGKTDGPRRRVLRRCHRPDRIRHPRGRARSGLLPAGLFF